MLKAFTGVATKIQDAKLLPTLERGVGDLADS